MKIRVVLPLLLLATPLSAQVQLHEIMASNGRSVPDVTDFEDYPDWIELKNTGGTTASLDGYFLSDDPGDPFKWPIPNGATIPANGYKVFAADGHDAAPGRLSRGDTGLGRISRRRNITPTSVSVPLGKPSP